MDLCCKQLFDPHVGPSSSMGYLSDPSQTQLHRSQQNLLHGMAGIVDSADALRRIANAQLISNTGLKDPLPQVLIEKCTHNTLTNPEKITT